MTNSSDIDWGILLDDLALSPEQANEALIQGIVVKDLKQVEQAIEAQADLKQVVGKEKLGVFALGYFNEGIVELLQKKGVSFKDNIKMIEKILTVDSVPALQWYLKSPSCKKYYGTTLKDQDALDFLTSSLQNGSSKCFVWLSQHPNFAPHLGNIKPVHLNQSFGKLLSKPWDECERVFNALKISPIVLAAVAQSALGLRGAAADTSLSKMTLGEIQNLQKLLKQKNAEKNMFPLAVYSNLLKQEAARIKTVLEPNIIPPSSQSNYYEKITTTANTLTELVVLTGGNACRVLSENEQGAQVMEKILKDPKTCAMFLHNSTKETRVKVLKKCKNLALWRDSLGNNIFHYALLVGEPSDKFAQDLLSINFELFQQPNNQNKTPLDMLPSSLSAKLQKAILSKNIAPTTKEKGKTHRAPSRKM